MEKYAIQIKGLSYVYPPDYQALKNINLKIKKNEFIGIIGQNGAGKSTLLKLISGLLKPVTGQICILGTDTKNSTVSTLASQVGLVLQNPDRQLFTLTVKEEVGFGPRNLGLPETEINERVDRALKTVGLTGTDDQFPPALSRGERAKVVIASVLAMQPEIIIFDEPTSGQDYRGCYQIMNLAQQLQKKGHTIIVVTHHMYLIAEYTERTVVMRSGEILLDAPTRKVFSYPEQLRETDITPPQITQLGFRIQDEIGLKQVILRVPELGEDLLEKFKNKKEEIKDNIR